MLRLFAMGRLPSLAWFVSGTSSPFAAGVQFSFWSLAAARSVCAACSVFRCVAAWLFLRWLVMVDPLDTDSYSKSRARLNGNVVAISGAETVRV